MTTAARHVSVVMLAYGAEPYLHDAVAAVLASVDVDVELVLVDNGCTTDAVATLPPDARLRVVRPPRNLGFTGGVAVGTAETTGDVLALVNSDAIVEPGALVALVRALDDETVGLVSGQVRLASDPTTVNSVGNPLHVLGLSWAGGMGDDVAAHAARTPVASVTGACMAARRSTWDALGGFPETFFAYLEDLEVSWRCWQHGLRVEYVPDAVAVHHYEFGRSPLKMYLVERNRLLFVATCYGGRMLALLALPLLAFELAILLVAVAQGWGRQKVRGWSWFLGHLGWVRRRRQAVQAARTVPDRDLAWLLTATFDPAQFPLPAGGGVAQAAMRAWWGAARRLL
ncbi:glycosyltransferase family 2 protein [Cellulomonas fimi]|uniref:glycosyltransferase family 2 protein n=1 Tax=Cellulomonas fimi TaxID=1708 RepID=UPI0023590B4F|nr:glycosyltransferase family 2 protein [Cellulomonas fimi]